MPTKHIEYSCNICGRRYPGRTDAQKCEDKGFMTTYQIGTIYGNHTDGAMYHDITFAVAENRAFTANPHLNDGSSWACRDNGPGDSLGENRCGSGFLNLGKYDGLVDTLAPHFYRMVAWLRGEGFQVHVWDGEKAVPYYEPLPDGYCVPEKLT